MLNEVYFIAIIVDLIILDRHHSQVNFPPSLKIFPSLTRKGEEGKNIVLKQTVMKSSHGTTRGFKRSTLTYRVFCRNFTVIILFIYKHSIEKKELNDTFTCSGIVCFIFFRIHWNKRRPMNIIHRFDILTLETH